MFAKHIFVLNLSIGNLRSETKATSEIDITRKEFRLLTIIHLFRRRVLLLSEQIQLKLANSVEKQEGREVSQTDIL